MNKLMKFDPVTGFEKPYPSEAKQFREYHGKAAWLYNPFTGTPRDPRDIGSDTFGLLIIPGKDAENDEDKILDKQSYTNGYVAGLRLAIHMVDSDSLAITFQSMRDYRLEIIKTLDRQIDKVKNGCDKGR